MYGMYELAPPQVRDIWNEWRDGSIDALTLENRAAELARTDPEARRFFNLLRQWDSPPTRDTIQ